MRCKHCKSTRVIRAGKKTLSGAGSGKARQQQVWQCKECGRYTIVEV